MSTNHGSSSSPDISVVLCTRNGGARILPTIASIRAALDRAAAHDVRGELVLVDNASTDQTAGALAAAAHDDQRLRVVDAPTPGLSRARNRGADAVRGRAVLFTDDDVLVPPHWVERLGAPLLLGEADLVNGAVRIADDLRRDWLTAQLAADYYAQVPEPPTVGGPFAGANLGVSAEVLAHVRFDETLGTARYPGADDIVFRLDVLAAGYRQAAVSGAVVEHHFDPDRLRPARLLRQARGYGRCEAYVARHLRGTETQPVVELAKVVITAGDVVVRSVLARGTAVDSALVLATRRAAYHRELLRLWHEPVRPGGVPVDERPGAPIRH